MSGRVLQIWVKPAHGSPMDDRSEVTLEANRGVEGNADQGGRRQVTLLEREVWEERTRDLSTPVPPVTRRANFLVEGIPLRESRGQTLSLGECELKIRGETKPCSLMDEACPGLKDALFPDWGGGAFAEVVQGGTIRVGDPVAWSE